MQMLSWIQSKFQNQLKSEMVLHIHHFGTDSARTKLLTKFGRTVNTHRLVGVADLLTPMLCEQKKILPPSFLTIQTYETDRFYGQIESSHRLKQLMRNGMPTIGKAVTSTVKNLYNWSPNCQWSKEENVFYFFFFSFLFMATECVGMFLKGRGHNNRMLPSGIQLDGEENP